MAVQYHTHIFEIPVASDADVAAGVISNKVVVPSNLGTAAVEDATAFATSSQGGKADTAMQPASYDPDGKVANAFDSANQDFVQNDVDAETRSVRDKLRDRSVDIADFFKPIDVDDTNSIQRAIAFVGASGGGVVNLPARTVTISDTIFLGDGAPGVGSTYNDVLLRGRGSAFLNSPASATRLLWNGVTSTTAAMVEIAGRSSGMSVQDIYLDADNKAGDCLVIKSNVCGRFSGILGHNYTRRGLTLTVQELAVNTSWYSSQNTFERCIFTSTNENTQAWRLGGRDEGGINNGAFRNTFISCLGSAVRSLDATHRPCALYLGYTDSNTYIECDFLLQTIANSLIVNDRNALSALNGTGRPDGQVIKVRYGDNLLGAVVAINIRQEYLWRYDAGSSAVEGDGTNVIEPADSVGRFIRYQGACVMMDADTRNNFPQNHMMYGCSLAKEPSIVDITTSGNEAGHAVNGWPAIKIVNFTTADSEQIPAFANVFGASDSGVDFGPRDVEFRGDGRNVSLVQKNNMRRFQARLNTSSSTGSDTANHFGTIFSHAERANDTASWSETGRIVMDRIGHWRPNANNSQDLGATAQMWKDAYVARILFDGLGIEIDTGNNSPEGVKTAPVGSLYMRRNGGAGTVLYVKESGTGNTGWVAK